VKFYLDEDLSPKIAISLRRRGIPALSAQELGRLELSDEEQLSFAAAESCVLVTRNRDDFVSLARDAIRASRPHAGIILCSPRYSGREIGEISRALAQVAAAYPKGLGPYDVVYLP
jgi:predicted nuclease of predicted toxin-antitoxin system